MFFRKKSKTIRERAVALMSPCSCGNTDFHEDIVNCAWLKCNVCGATADLYCEMALENQEQRRLYGRGDIDILFDKYLPQSNKKTYLRVVK